MPLINVSMRKKCKMLQMLSNLKGGQKPSRILMIKYSIQYIYKSAYIYMTTCPFNYVEDCRAADVLQKCAGKNVLNCKKWKRARDIK